jgi:hypothetical protein
MPGSALILAKIVEKRIFIIRETRVVLSTDLADLYQISPKVLMQAVKRNIERFPDDFMFQLSLEEGKALLRSQIVTLEKNQHLKYAPYAFTEQGVAMLSGVLNSQTAIKVNLEIMRVFVRMRELISTNSVLLKKIEALEQKFEGHDKELKEVFQTIRDLLIPAIQPKRTIGVRSKNK